MEIPAPVVERSLDESIAVENGGRGFSEKGLYRPAHDLRPVANLGFELRLCGRTDMVSEQDRRSFCIKRKIPTLERNSTSPPSSSKQSQTLL